MLLISEAQTAEAELPPETVAVVNEVKFEKHDEFQKELKRRVEQHFRSTGQSPRDCWQMYVKTAVILGWFAASYWFLVFGPVTWWTVIPACASLGLAMAAIGFSIQHDGGHRAYSRFPIVNKLAAMSLDMLGGSSYYWARKHNSIHHTYANITGHDDDIELGILGRLSPYQRRLRFHRWQHIYLWFLYGFLTIKWQFHDDYRDFVQKRIGVHPVPRPKGRDLVQFIVGKTFFVTMALALPMLMHPVLDVLLAYLCVSFFQGVTLSVVFQIAHCVEEATFPMPEPESGRMQKSFAAHQIETTVNFAPDNRLLSWLVGGLNYQIEHHLFPQICHIHYRALSPLVKKTAEEFGLRYTIYRTLRGGIASHYRWLRQMGTAEEQPCAAPSAG